MKQVNALVAAALVLGCGTVQAGSINNPSFETDGHIMDLNTGWTRDPSTVGSGVAEGCSSGPGAPAVCTAHTYKPTDGNYLLWLQSGDTTNDTWRTFTQEITGVFSGQELSGYAAFAWNDYDPYFDAARVRITDTSGYAQNAWFMSGDTLPAGQAYVDWQKWTWIAPWAGNFKLEYGVTNTTPPGLDDSDGSSYAFFDGVPTVPEPSFLALFVIGLAGLSSMQRRSRTASLAQSS